MATFLANKINATDRDVTGPIEQVQIMFPLGTGQKEQGGGGGGRSISKCGG